MKIAVYLPITSSQISKVGYAIAIAIAIYMFVQIKATFVFPSRQEYQEYHRIDI